MTGTQINAALILIALAIGILLKYQFPAKLQNMARLFLAGFSFFLGIKLMVKTFDPGFIIGFKLILIALVSILLGNIVGKLIKIQRISNKLGNFSKEQIEKALKTQLFDDPSNHSEPAQKENTVYQTTPNEKQDVASPPQLTMSMIILICINPIGIIGAIYEGIRFSPNILIVKAIMDFFFSLSLARFFKLNIILAILPMILWQTILTIGFRLASNLEFFANNLTKSSYDALCGFFCFIFVLPILEIKKVELTNYLPSLLITPVLVKLLM